MLCVSASVISPIEHSEIDMPTKTDIAVTIYASALLRDGDWPVTPIAEATFSQLSSETLSSTKHTT
jgi:hypothetical protein